MMHDGELTSGGLAAMGGAAGLMQRQWAPCRYHCPVHADVRAYIELIARGQYRSAVDVIRANLPFACVCGRICHHPCEANCRRNDVDEPVAIRELKRFVAELQGAAGSTVRKAPVQDKARVAVVGAGPAGLAAALDLARMGYRPVAFEKFPVAGGIPATAVPKYRLPRDVLRHDVEWILSHGIELRTGVEIGADQTIDGLLAEGFAAVIVATGLPKSRALDVPGMDHRRVLGAMEFLTAAAMDRPMDVGRDVLVIGGWNVAMDAARTALRLGGGRVRAMCLENEQEMPAWAWERREAEEEGVGFIRRRGPAEVLLRGGEIVGVKARKVTRVFDEAGRFAPLYDDADVIEPDCDTVVLAIGQQADMGFARGSGLAADDRGRLVYDPATHETSVPGVFACGEIVTAPGSVVEACAHGQRAAAAVDMYLRGVPVRIDDELPPAIGTISQEVGGKVTKVARAVIAARPAAERAGCFAEIDLTMSEAEALRESRRCMSCGGGAEVIVDKCAACLTCLRVCPFGIPVVTDVARISSDLCQACGMCIADCPAHAIVARSWSAEDLKAATDAALGRLPAGEGARRVVAFVCGHHAPANAWRGSLDDAVGGVAELYLPSMARLSTEQVLHAFEAGADGVVVVACRLGADRYPHATERVRKRVTAVNEMLAEAGLGPDRVQLTETASQGRAAMREAIAAAADRIAAL